MGNEASSSADKSEHHSHTHFNPFAIGPLRQDGKVENRRPRKRDRLSRAGRSLSPFRHGRSSSLGRIPSALMASLSGASSSQKKLLSIPRSSNTPSSSASTASEGSASEAGDTDHEDHPADESDAESVGKAFQPRTTSFRGGKGTDTEDEAGSDEDWEDRERRQVQERNKEYAAEDEEQDGQRSSQDDEEEDSMVDFDDATIDNTLFNAGCLDLHNAWQNNRESIGEGGWYPEDDDPSWHTHNHDHSHDHGDHDGRHAGSTNVAEPEEDDGYDSGVRMAPLDGAAPTSPTQDPHSRLPNVILPSSFKPNEAKRQGSKWVSSGGTGSNAYTLVATRPTFAKNRCTITLRHGEYEEAVKRREAGGSRGPKRWIVASDGSEESSYAIEWTIGTVLRDGDETLVVSIMETSEKLDKKTHSESASAKAFQKENQQIRQDMAVRLARQATSLLQRTRLAVKISCQALHAKHSRHMLLDLIDFYEPTMVIVGSRGLGSLKGILLGSTSHYLVQKSSVPVMVARKRLQLPALPRGRADVVSSVRRRHMRLDEAAIEKKSKVAEEEGEGDDDSSNGETDNEAAGDHSKEEGKEESKAESSTAGRDEPSREGEVAATDKKDEESAEAKRRREGQQAVAAKQMERSLRTATEPSPEDTQRGSTLAPPLPPLADEGQSSQEFSTADEDLVAGEQIARPEEGSSRAAIEEGVDKLSLPSEQNEEVVRRGRSQSRSDSRSST